MSRTEAESGKGRLLRGGRAVTRVVLVWLTVSGALYALDALLPGFAMSRWWQPTVCALLLGLMTSVVWPLVMRIALPIALLTFGLGSFLILGAATLAIFNAIPGVEIANLRSAVFVVIGMSATSAVISGILAVDEDESFFRRARRRAGPSGPDADQPPGVLFLQIDGLGYDTVRRAVRDGDMPTFARWIGQDSHALRMWHTDWSSQTGAAVCAILHGSNEDILGFRWYEKDRDHVMACAHPADAAEIERRHSDGAGLLSEGGAARGNLFSGDAPHVSLTMSSVNVLLPKGYRRTRKEEGRVGAGYYAYFANPANALRTLAVALVDVFREISASARQRRADVRPRVKRGGFYPFARSATTVITRDIVVSAIIEDMLAGRPAVYADFLGYDEVAHHSGIERFDSLAVLRSIDQQFGRLERAAALAPRKYHLVALSDHGQTQGWAFADRFGEPIQQVVGRLCGAPDPVRTRGSSSPVGHDPRRTSEPWLVQAALAEATSRGGLIARRLRGRVERLGASETKSRTETGEPGQVARAAPGVVVVASGHLAMVSFTAHQGRVELETIEREYPELLPSLVDHDGVGFMLVRSAEFGPVVLGRDGLHRLATGVIIGADPLSAYGPHAADLVRRVDTFEHCADIMINSRYEPETDDASPFEPHVGSHGGLGGPQARGFLLYPKGFAPAPEIVGAEQLHRVLRGWMNDLGHFAGSEEATVPDAVPAEN